VARPQAVQTVPGRLQQLLVRGRPRAARRGGCFSKRKPEHTQAGGPPSPLLLLPDPAAYAHRAALLAVPSNAVVVPLTAVLTPMAMVAVLFSYVSRVLAWLPALLSAT
jgi:hypothetical protein